jgi:hypothetical protein
MKSINHHNNPQLYDFTQSSNGFGFSNMRNDNHDTLDRNTPHEYSNVYVDPHINNSSNYEHNRHDNFLFTEHYKDFNLIDQQNSNEYNYYDIMKTFQEINPLIKLFFSKKNIDHIQGLIIKMISFQSEGVYNISRQSDNELLIVMRSIYIKTPTNPYAQGQELKNNICILNKNVLDWVIPRLMINIQQYLGYMRDRSNVAMPLRHPEYMSSAGNRINRGFDVSFI